MTRWKQQKSSLRQYTHFLWHRSDLRGVKHSVYPKYWPLYSCSIKGTVSRDFYHFFGLKDSTWAPYELAKMVSQTFSFSRRYSRKREHSSIYYFRNALMSSLALFYSWSATHLLFFICDLQLIWFMIFCDLQYNSLLHDHLFTCYLHPLFSSCSPVICNSFDSWSPVIYNSFD